MSLNHNLSFSSLFAVADKLVASGSVRTTRDDFFHLPRFSNEYACRWCYFQHKVQGVRCLCCVLLWFVSTQICRWKTVAITRVKCEDPSRVSWLPWRITYLFEVLCTDYVTSISVILAIILISRNRKSRKCPSKPTRDTWCSSQTGIFVRQAHRNWNANYYSLQFIIS